MKIHELIDKPEKWLKGALASDLPPDSIHEVSTQGNYLNGESPKAVCWCIVGALQKIYGSFEAMNKADLVASKLGLKDLGGLVTWNNSPDLTFEQFHAKLVEHDI